MYCVPLWGKTRFKRLSWIKNFIYSLCLDRFFHRRLDILYKRDLQELWSAPQGSDLWFCADIFSIVSHVWTYHFWNNGRSRSNVSKLWLNFYFLISKTYFIYRSRLFHWKLGLYCILFLLICFLPFQISYFIVYNSGLSNISLDKITAFVWLIQTFSYKFACSDGSSYLVAWYGYSWCFCFGKWATRFRF